MHCRCLDIIYTYNSAWSYAREQWVLCPWPCSQGNFNIAQLPQMERGHTTHRFLRLYKFIPTDHCRLLHPPTPLSEFCRVQGTGPQLWHSPTFGAIGSVPRVHVCYAMR